MAETVANYWEVEDLVLDTAAGKAAKGAAAFKQQVIQLQTDLIALGYLGGKADGGYGPGTTRALLRFQRHAARRYRMPQPDAAAAETFQGVADGTCDATTAQEVRKWIDNGWKLPLDRFALTAVSAPNAVGKLRSDAAAAWTEIVRLVTSKGGTLAGPYGDTARAVRPTSKVGTSRYSFHYCGRAVDISQALGGGANQRYFIAKESSGASTMWRIYCKTDKQDGAQGVLIRKDTVTCYAFHNWTEYKLKEGYYFDMTAVIESTGKFERIPAQGGWNGSYNKTEWWHFQYKLDKQPTFLDEMELIGYTEAKLKAAGWSSPQLLDHAPG
jgi:peptidoglycan hydrolase-like protein with peptidoglycan-binding domain